MIAVLPMYDRSEIRDATDGLWAAIRDGMHARGLSAPERLDRKTPASEAWRDPALVLGQTCGLPYVSGLADRVALIGTPDYGVEDCPPGHYCSVLAVRVDDAREDLAAFRGARPAVNERGSQSGYAALMVAAAPFARDGRFFGGPVMSGAHRASAAAVADGAADIAAIDAVTWRLIERHESDLARRLRVLARTPPTPGLPLIAAPRVDGEGTAAAVADAIAALDTPTRRALLLRGLVRFDRTAYRPLFDAVTRAEAIHMLSEN